MNNDNLAAAMAALIGAGQVNGGSQFMLTAGRFRQPSRPRVPPSIYEPYRAPAHRMIKGRQRNEACPCGCGKKRKNCMG